jgi:hypothetical protein
MEPRASTPRRPIGVLLLLCALAASCGGGDSLSDFEPPPPPPFSVTGRALTIVDFLEPLAGATACVFPAGEPCATSDAAGIFTIDAYPAAVEAGVLMTAPGHFGVLLPIIALPSDLGPEIVEPLIQSLFLPVLLRDADAQFLIEFQGGTYPTSTTGFIQFDVFDPTTGLPLEGATVSANVPVGTGPVYLDANSIPDPTLTATSIVGTGSLLNVPPGDVDLTITRPGYSCTTPTGFVLGWVGTPDGFIANTRAPVVVGANTRVFVSCCPNDRLIDGGRSCDLEGGA